MMPGDCRRRWLLAACLAVTSAAGIANAAPGTDEFAMSDLDGARQDLFEQVGTGGWTLVLFWTLDCVPCEAQKPMLERFHRVHRESGTANVLGVALDGPAAIAAIRSRVAANGSTFPTLVAYDDVFAAQYDAILGTSFRATPTYWLFDPAGRLAGAHVGSITRAELEAIVTGRSG